MDEKSNADRFAEAMDGYQLRKKLAKKKHRAPKQPKPIPFVAGQTRLAPVVTSRQSLDREAMRRRNDLLTEQAYARDMEAHKRRSV